ncbi:tRNA lysidine(34) synthetase TilS [Paracoccus denitrificans]|jgi:tRNA(Ile)-lysidine synthase|uniref:tRNA(Ile)-lysidine synthase n=1 Tax=Paracoccus denitrificans (strain Pd 1222) TaxID=318586 RepID=A1AZV7_PARDP|nr:tRNA lysidine(34) synthetase TilS [Paracoccus denitrificans]ABL68801.1 tRNA(Ile)-lysidine synthetase [Paracoccus denitrificans PD1222]MBB4625473.1 tRNA(Ile)-lysidine synthase [Paracoccus denitrificans]MCU7428299.1 tRNA lysidine(34) synthetase TilS [Paracoccus denitrificans]QAR26850.1 tRNA lysidine(34) synthetase TilS [Paracoccus denitrificans]UPV95806.1 tRNA lysidine(34) synthetase TilS [Paracoccus denitrificans]
MTAEPVAARVHAALDRLAGHRPTLGIALSGGGDSTALMHLAHGWGRARLLAATVDHGLRPGSADEARQAGLAAAALDIPHETLRWTRRGGGNLMAAAREARLQLLAGWAGRHGLSAVLLGHTLDDQAETLLMRLNRGAGVDGLSAMAPMREAFGVTWLRPMLEIGRADLRHWLAARGLGWADDPSNENEDFERVRVRKAIAALDLPMRQLAQSAANLAMARDALCDFASRVAEGAQSRAGSLALPLDAFRAAPLEIRRRLLVAGLRFVGGSDYPPRRGPLLHALAVLEDGGRLTLEGVIAEPRDGFLWLVREPAAALRSPAAEGADAIWDRRWQVAGLRPGDQVRALGHEPLPGFDWRGAGLMRDEAAASPGIWAGDRLIAAPVLRPAPGYGAKPLRGVKEFRGLLYTH